MHRIGGKLNLFSNSGHQYGEEDPRIKSKCSTPKRHDNRKLDPQFQQQDSHTQTLTKKTAYFTKTSSSQQAKNQLQKQLLLKIESYNVVSGTLKQYFKQQKLSKSNRKNKNSKAQVLNTTVEMIKAFARTQITEVSPHLTQLITQMLDTLPLCSAKARNKKSKSIKQLHPNKSTIENDKKHSRQFSFAKRNEKQAKKQEERRIKTQIQILEQNLQDLRQQAEVLQSIKDEFDDMTQSNKREYISELQQIIEKQQQMLDKLNGQS